MDRRFLALVLAISIALPPASLAAEGANDSDRGGWSRVSGPFFWGALAVLNGTLLASSVMNMQFYESRANDLEAIGEDATDYWDASSRQKVMIGVSSVSLLFSLAALKGSLHSPPRATEPEFTPIARPEANTGETGPVRVLALEGRVRYDTLITAAPKEKSSPGPFEWFHLDDRVPADDSPAAGVVTPPSSKPAPSTKTTAATLPDGAKPVSLADLGETDGVFTRAGVGAAPPVDGAESETDDLDRLLAFLQESRAAETRAAEKAPVGAEEVVVGEEAPAADTTDAGTRPPVIVTADPLTEALRRVHGGAAPSAPLPTLKVAPEETPPPAEETEGEEEETPPTFALAPYAVHVSSYQTMRRAEMDEGLWTDRGERVVIEEDEILEKGVWYRVFVGNFDSYGEAKAYAEKLIAEYGLDYAQVKKRSGF